MMLDSFVRLHRAFWQDNCVGLSESLSHHVLQDQRHEADHRVRPNALGQSAKQMLIGQRTQGHVRQRYRLGPSQHIKFGVRITQAV